MMVTFIDTTKNEMKSILKIQTDFGKKENEKIQQYLEIEKIK